jgi:hypothetical protein
VVHATAFRCIPELFFEFLKIFPSPQNLANALECENDEAEEADVEDRVLEVDETKVADTVLQVQAAGLAAHRLLEGAL